MVATFLEAKIPPIPDIRRAYRLRASQQMPASSPFSATGFASRLPAASSRQIEYRLLIAIFRAHNFIESAAAKLYRAAANMPRYQ